MGRVTESRTPGLPAGSSWRWPTDGHVADPLDVVGCDIRNLGAGVRGLRAVVCEAGVIGLLVALRARHVGAAEVVVLDDTEARRSVAEALGAEALPTTEAWQTLKVRWRHGAGDRGADVGF